MANRKPLVIVSGELQSIKLGDILVDSSNTPYSTGGGEGDVEPNTQIVFGTDTGVTSSQDLTYDTTRGRFNVGLHPDGFTPVTKDFPDNTNMFAASARRFIEPATPGQMFVIFNFVCQPGHLSFILATPLVDGTEATGLANDATIYTTTITIDGTPNLVLITGSTAQIFNDLATQISSQITGGFATVDGTSLFPPGSGEFRIVSNSCGVTSTVTASVTSVPPDLFASLIAPYNVTSTSSIPGVDTATTPTGLTPGSYMEEIDIDAVPHFVTITDVNASTIDDLITQLTTQLAPFATVSFNNNNQITISSATTGITSTVSSPQTGFLQTLGGPIVPLQGGFISPIPGGDAFLNQHIPGNLNLSAGTPTTGTGGSGITITATNGGSVIGDGGGIFITAGNATNGVGGDIILSPGTGGGQHSGRVVYNSKHRIEENNTFIYEVSGNSGTNLVNGDGVEITLNPDNNLTAFCGSGVFEIWAVGQDTNQPPISFGSVIIRGSYVNQVIVRTLKETYTSAVEILSASNGGSTFTVRGDQTAKFPITPSGAHIFETTSNDGTYDVISTTFFAATSTTVIGVTPAPADQGTEGLIGPNNTVTNTLDVTMLQVAFVPTLRITASSGTGIVWRARVAITQQSANCF